MFFVFYLISTRELFCQLSLTSNSDGNYCIIKNIQFVYIYTVMCVYVFQCNFNIGIESFQMDPFLAFSHQNLHKLTCISYVLHASLSSIFDHPKNIVNCENHEASHHENCTRPPLLRPSQTTPPKKGYFVEIFYIFSTFNFH